MMLMIVMSIEYDEPDPDTYRRVVASFIDEGRNKVWETDDFVKDVNDANKYLKELQRTNSAYTIMSSSTVDSFFHYYNLKHPDQPIEYAE